MTEEKAKSAEMSKGELLAILQKNSLFRGDFTLSSGAKSNYYIDCKLTTLNPRGAWLVGELVYDLIQKEASSRGVNISGVGGLTMGADPISLSVGMISAQRNSSQPLKVFSVRKTQKAHGQTKLIEGNFEKGDMVVIIDDVVTRGESTLKAIEAVLASHGAIAFVVVLVDRQEGGKEKIEEKGYEVVSIFTRDELLGNHAESRQRTDRIAA